MTAHSALTGANLHEPKGAASASANTAYVADGAGSGTWEKITQDSIDTTSIKDNNKVYQTVTLRSIQSAGLVVLPITATCTLNLVTTAISAALGTANVTLTVYKNGSNSAGTITVAFSGSAKGDIDSLTPATNNTFVSGDYVEISSGGGGSGTVDATIVLEFTLT